MIFRTRNCHDRLSALTNVFTRSPAPHHGKDRNSPMADSAYAEFLNRKAQLAGRHGFAPIFQPSWLYDFQADLVEWAVSAHPDLVQAELEKPCP